MGFTLRGALKGVSVWTFDEKRSASELARNPEYILPHEIVERIGKTSIDSNTLSFTTNVEFNNQPLGIKAHAVQVEVPDRSARGGKRVYAILLFTDAHYDLDQDVLIEIAEDFKQTRNVNHFVLSLPVVAPNVRSVFEQMRKNEEACILFFVNGDVIDSHNIDDKVHRPAIAKSALVRLWHRIEDLFYDLERLFTGPRSKQKIETLKNSWRNRVVNTLSSWEPLQYMVIPLPDEKVMILIRATPVYCLGLVTERNQLFQAFQRIFKYIRLLGGNPAPLEEQFKNLEPKDAKPPPLLSGTVLTLPSTTEKQPEAPQHEKQPNTLATPDINLLKILLEKEKNLDEEAALISRKSKIRRVTTVGVPPHFSFFMDSTVSGMTIEDMLNYIRKHHTQISIDEHLLKKILLKLEKTGNIKIERTPL